MSDTFFENCHRVKNQTLKLAFLQEKFIDKQEMDHSICTEKLFHEDDKNTRIFVADCLKLILDGTVFMASIHLNMCLYVFFLSDVIVLLQS